MIGVDEVGRGCLAGPLLVVGARAIADLPAGLKDSKLLSIKKRLIFYELLTGCCHFGEGWVQAAEIDDLGLANALRLGVRRALANINAKVGEDIIMDGKYNYISKKYKNSHAMIGGDNIVPIISAASIYAKVTRDNFMYNLGTKHPGYGFESHVGYGTSFHKSALRSLGTIKSVHRASFQPIKILDA